jgi:uncharacterized repeat protein (TIGR03837 family)
MLWDIFCQVIDNHGDAGVCWRLARGLAAEGHRVRLRIDDASMLQWMAPGGAQGVEVLAWDAPAAPGDVVVEAFGCELPAAFQAALAEATRERGRQPGWINLEYLTAEAFALRNHGLASPVLAGPAKGLAKRFFYPGFMPGTGGLLRERDLIERQARFDAAAWLEARGIPASGERRISLFCYEPAALGPLLGRLAEDPAPTRLLVTAGRATEAVRSALPASAGALRPTFLPLLTQEDFDRLLWSCDLNFVRGEDSLVRAIWAGRPFVWQLYPQDDDVHHAKLQAFLEWLQPSPSLASAFRAWNGIGGEFPLPGDGSWAAAALAARERLLLQEDLVAQLVRFVRREFGG